MINFNNLSKKDQLDLLLTESELGTLELQYIASQHGCGEAPLLGTCIKLLYRNQLLEKDNKEFRKQRSNVIEYIKSKNGYGDLNYYKDILNMLGDGDIDE